ncbi:MAG: zinc-binding dehydrogenase [Microthrixaceae bacterium]|nr:zinc-binding dehydrogenase [Microthrixaceae bacterium]
MLVTGIGGGVATAAMSLALHLGAEVAVTSRDPEKRARALEFGAFAAFDSKDAFRCRPTWSWTASGLRCRSLRYVR